MRRYGIPIFLSVFLLAGGTATRANAQSAEAHVAAARAAASESGLHDFAGTFTAVCAEREPGTQGLPTPGEPANFDDRPIPER